MHRSVLPGLSRPRHWHSPWCLLSPGFSPITPPSRWIYGSTCLSPPSGGPGLTFRFFGDPWSNLTSPGQEWFLTRFGASLCQHSLAPKFSILPLEFSQHAPSRSSGSGFMLLGPLFTYLSKIVTWQCGLSSVRVGEASHPGRGSSPNNELLVLPQVNKRPRTRISSQARTPRSSFPGSLVLSGLFLRGSLPGILTWMDLFQGPPVSS